MSRVNGSAELLSFPSEILFIVLQMSKLIALVSWAEWDARKRSMYRTWFFNVLNAILDTGLETDSTLFAVGTGCQSEASLWGQKDYHFVQILV